MKIIIKESQLNLLLEQNVESSADSCNKSVSNVESTASKWRSLDEETKKEKLGIIKNDIINSVKRAISEYTAWFSNPQTLAKFKDQRELAVAKKIPAYLATIKNVKFSLTGPNGRDTVIAWVTPSDMTTVYYNIARIHDTENYIGTSISETTKHEIGHLIDFFLKNNKVSTYINTVDTSSQEEYQREYIINDKDQYTRLNVLRGLIGAQPADNGYVLLTKFLGKVRSGVISSNKYNFSGISSNTTTTKNDSAKATEIYKKLRNTIMVNDTHSLNLEQLFATFAVEKNGAIFVNFDLIGDLNITSKAADRKYYFLKLS